jgi:hypothetical protein
MYQQQQQQQIQRKTQIIRDTIKAIVAQLDCWETDHQEQEAHCLRANNRFLQGTVDRQALAGSTPSLHHFKYSRNSGSSL